MSDHAVASPSSSARRFKCGASRWMHERYRDHEIPSRYSQAGTDDHCELERCLIDGCTSERTPVQVCVDYVDEVRDSFDEIIEERFEQRLVSRIIPEHFGTVDVFIRGWRNDVLTGCVLDAKFGFLPVERRGNKQALEYVALCAEYFDCDRWFYSIMQPVQHDEFHLYEATDEDIENIRAEELNSRSNRNFAPGDHCRFCNAINHCAALRNEMYKIAAHGFDDTDYPKEWAHILSMETAVKSLFDQVRRACIDHITKGGSIRGHKAVESLGNRAWKSTRQIKELAKLVGIELSQLKKNEYVTPTEAERILKKLGRDVNVLKDYVHREERGLMLVTSDDKRSAVTFPDIKDAFNVK